MKYWVTTTIAFPMDITLDKVVYPNTAAEFIKMLGKDGKRKAIKKLKDEGYTVCDAVNVDIITDMDKYSRGILGMTREDIVKFVDPDFKKEYEEYHGKQE